MFEVRAYQADDTPYLWQLFHDTIHNINVRDYSLEQVNAWAPKNVDLNVWQARLDALSPFVAETNGVIVGYADLQDNGLIDHFYCHHQYQGCGVARLLMEHIHSKAKSKGITRLHSEVSITALPFYEYFGFSIVKEQHVEVRGQKLKNYRMEKRLN